MNVRKLLLTLAVFAMPEAAGSATILISGIVTQSTENGTGPAGNNPSLNNIQNSQGFTITLDFPGTLSGPGFYDLTGSTLIFAVPEAPAVESDFGSIALTITQNAGFDEFRLFACLNTGSGCGFGNQMSVSFMIPEGNLNALHVPAIGLDEPHPLDLLEDDGVTDIQGQITMYSGADVSVPEPTTAALQLLSVSTLLLLKISQRVTGASS